MTKTDLANLQARLQTALESYIKAFEKKHECELDHVVGDELMGAVCFGDRFFTAADIVYDIDNMLPKGMIYEWQDAMVEQHFKTPDAPATNLMHWHMAQTQSNERTAWLRHQKSRIASFWLSEPVQPCGIQGLLSTI